MLWKYYLDILISIRAKGRGYDTHVSPPRARSPPERANPDVARLHGAERALHGGNARRVRARADLAEEALEVVLLEPRGRVLEALAADRRGHALVGRARAVGVEVLVHLYVVGAKSVS